MAGESFIILPDGTIRNIVGGDSPAVDNIAGEWVMGDYKKPFPTTIAAKSFHSAVGTGLIAASMAVKLLVLPTVISVEPSNFSLSNDLIIVRGSGFTPGGKIWIADKAGGQDQIDTSYTLEFISEFEVRGTWISNGSGGAIISPGAAIILFFVAADTTTLSNSLVGITDGVDNVAFPFPQ